MQSACPVFVGSLNREAPYFQGARGVGLGVYAFGEATLAVQKLAETDEVDNPTFLSVTPSGRHLFSANQNADRISIFARDETSGRLTGTGRAIEIGTPMCVRITRDPLRS
ncbi:beta-propeller fold lactonase family protein [Mesorhizobium humile]|uniref:Beta-propeller fold lactonase family protein n=1 Tax=Mesorhizobium humile TaxID=3072313 RepID=A0ABU4YAQ0_9HYPH|nr:MULTISPECIES: beta-propeller fold lactonase family protein [unclassified Mesorhizobium]MDX8458605.1 beta-propeller fold lactonase family protein [Mesorhizobium sp. VK2D]MDX8484017.1 beta-propeller fold lactonase family protein [Mesorhizobium sp. VK2B]